MKDSYALNVGVINFKLEKLSLICLEEPAERTSSDTEENVSAKTSRWHPVKSQTRQKIQAKGGHRHSHDEIFCKQKIDQSFYTLDVEKTLGWPNKYR